MKKSIFVFIAVILPYISFAQLALGFKIVPPFGNASSLVGNIEVNGEQRTVHGGTTIVNAGIFANYLLSSIVSVQTELNYKDEAFTYFPGNGYINSFGFSVAEMPVLLMAGWNVNNNFQVFLSAGPALKYRIGAGHSWRENLERHSSSENLFSKFVLSANAGLGVMFRLTYFLILSVEMRYSYDLTRSIGSEKITDIHSKEEMRFDAGKFHEVYYWLGVAYKFDLKKK